MDRFLPQFLKVSRIDELPILHIALNRPETMNALSTQLMAELYQIFLEAKEDASIKAILLTGEGKSFCAGADIKQLLPLNGQTGVSYAQQGQKIFRALEQLGKPSLAAIQGFTLGGGCELAMAATLRIATPSAIFGQPEVKLGLIPGFGGTQRLARLIGKGRALDLCVTGRTIKAEEALKWGLINEVVEPDNLFSRAKKILQNITQLGPIALQSILAVIDQGYDLSLSDACEIEAVHFGLCCTTQDKNEGINAFLEKRTAVFCGT